MKNLYLILVIICITINKIESKKLKLVLLIFRHGDRTPVFQYPTDPYADEAKYWPDGYHQLTIKGKQRMYSLGQYLRKRYQKFLSDTPREVFTRSSARGRCLESAAQVLAGLYPPKDRWVWTDQPLGQLWQPFPIQTVEFIKDSMLNPESFCPAATAESLVIDKSATVQQFYQKYKDLIGFIRQKSGHKFTDYGNGRDLSNTFEVQKVHNYSPPDWVNQTVLDGLRDFHEMSFIFDSSTPLIRRLRAGVLLKDITNRMRQSIDEKNFKYKLFLYATHDTQLSVFLSALDVYNGRSPPLGSTIIIELYQKSGAKSKDECIYCNHFLEMYYLNVTETEQPFKLKLNICRPTGPKVTKTSDCRLNHFLDSVKDLLPKDWQKECQKNFIQSISRTEL